MPATFSGHLLYEGTVLAVSAPGGMARHYRVQIQDSLHAGEWHLHASFRDLANAQACLCELVSQGFSARVVGYETLPTGG